MMDKISQDAKGSNVKDVLIQRDQDRKAKLKNIKDEKELSTPDQVKVFHESFDEHTEKILDSIKLIEERKIQEGDLPEHFSKISKDLQILNRFLSVSTVFLKNYSVRRSLTTVEELEAKIRALEAEFLPKKKFAFKARKTKVAGKSNSKADEVDSVIKKIIPFTIVSCGFYDQSNKNLKLTGNDIFKKDVELRNLERCTIFLCGNPSTVHMSNLKSCKVLIGPVSTSVFVENCQNCDLVIACQQLRIHSTQGSRFYIHVTSRAIIEDSSNVEFAPYNLVYDEIEEHFGSSGLDKNQNNWNQIDDFNWLASDVSSPNWKVINEEERVSGWLL